MARASFGRLLESSTCTACRSRTPQNTIWRRAFSSTPRTAADDGATTPFEPPAAARDVSTKRGSLRNLADSLDRFTPHSGTSTGPSVSDALSELMGKPSTPSSFKTSTFDEPHHLHVYSTRHNTHITLTRPNNESIMSMSSGNLGFRKGQRGKYDAGFQLAAYFMKSIQDRGLLGTGTGTREPRIEKLEVIFRGFGQGREAIQKALLGNEGRNLRNRVIRVSDSTRLKIGGTRAQNPRRL
ncbi:translational machinery component [Trichodelitschia bisporula]|uniref:Translational machinery component n=1 Tax=Trichodelitschia bisporula TaxID=703511 RepID=A0A6G1HYY7_9PEZI|nr:translational machinery component [Trichodelitschia bisporula]